MKKLNILLILYLTSILTSSDVNGNSTVDYYVNLINEESTRALIYPLPTDSSNFKPTLPNTIVYGTYDYIIVGAGSAGAVIANRLSENPNNEILLLEAGGNETNFSEIPGMNVFLQGLEFNWNYNTTTQTTSCLGMLNQQCAFPRGMSIGGTSAINTLIYVRGNKEDYNNWFHQGNTGWSYDEVLPYFIKSENSRIKDGDEGYRGKGGYLNVEHRSDESPQFKAFLKANLKLGRKIIDYNGKEQLGVSKVQFNTNRGRRDSTGRAFLEPAMSRRNLHILTHSLVTKILIKQKSNVAYGVRFSRKGGSFIVKARKEVIVSAGTIGSAQLLMLSGIGPKEHLRQLGIPVLQPLSVGKNLQDHALYSTLFFETNYTEPHKTLKKKVEEYLNDSGPLSIAGNAHGIGFFQTNPINNSNKNNSALPDIELVFVPSNNTSDFVKKALHFTDETYNSIWKKVNPTKSFTIMVILLHPKSRGEIKLRSKDPYEYPAINTNYFSDNEGADIEMLYKGIQLAMEIVDTEPFKKINASLVYAPLPACQNHEYLSRNYWYCQIRQIASHLFHPIGTCKMGPDSQDGAVVNHELKVHGVKRLRVADASIIPDAVSAHTNAPAIMIGEKASDMIKRESGFVG